jgi:hypothetical protein
MFRAKAFLEVKQNGANDDMERFDDMSVFLPNLELDIHYGGLNIGSNIAKIKSSTND